MSHFLCGEVSLRETTLPDQLEALAFDLVGCAHENRLHIFVGGGMQDIVFDILARPRLNFPFVPQLPFLVCDSPLECTSEGVINPSPVGGTPDQWRASVSANLERVMRILSKTFEHDVVRSIILTFSDGFSSEYNEIECGLPRFGSVCMREYGEKLQWEVPRIRVVVRRT